MGDTNPAYTGPDAIAPPTMLQAWTMGGLSGHAGRSAAYDELLALLDGAGYTSVVATDCEQEYLRPLRPGDRITFDSVIESVSERKTTKLGTGYFVTTRMDVRVATASRSRHPPLPHPQVRAGHAPRTRPGRDPATQPRRRSSSPRDGNAAKPEPAAPEAAEKQPRRPRPVVNRDNAGFWEGVAAPPAAHPALHRLRHPPLPLAAGLQRLRVARVGHGRGERRRAPSTRTSSCTTRPSRPSTRRTRSG